MASHGIQTRPEDTLLAERARDFLAGGPTDSVTLVRHVVQQPGTPPAVAERMVEQIFAGRAEFARCADGRWRLAAQPDPSRVEEPSPAVSPLARVPTFDEWRAQRAAAGAEQRARGAAPRVAPPAPASRSLAPLAPAAGPAPDASLHSLSYVVVDVETTGGSPHAGHRITEIAAVVVRDGEVRDVYETLVNPQRPIPPMIMKLTGITMEMVRGKQPFRDICPRILEAVTGHVFVAHNVNFDWRFVTAEVARASGQQLDGPRLCTVRLARKLLPQLRSRSLGFVADHYGADEFARDYFERRHGRDRPWRHSAAGDAVATAHCMLRLFRDAADRGIVTWGDLDALLNGGTASRRRKKRSALPLPVDRDTTA